jgi:hypothetical protein
MSMSQSSAQRLDPFDCSNFLVSWDGAIVSGVSNVTALRLTLGSTPGAEPVADPIDFVRARTTDPTFEQWARNPTPKLITVSLLDAAREIGISFLLNECIPVHYTLLDPLDASASQVALERLQVRCGSIRLLPEVS